MNAFAKLAKRLALHPRPPLHEPMAGTKLRIGITRMAHEATVSTKLSHTAKLSLFRRPGC